MTSAKSLTDATRARAEARFQLTEQRKSEAEKAMQDVNEAKAAEAAKTLRLRALRLAKEEQDRVTAAAQPPKPATRKKAVSAAAR